VAVAVLAAVLVPPRIPPAPAPPAVAAAGADAPLYVQFRLSAPGASQVAVAGSFTDWRPEYELTEVEPGLWSVMVPLRPGVYDYTFVIDGERMVVDPYAPRVADSFGGSNSRLFLPAPSGRA
jgi:1,4-alpha-glucan branching enzyme